MFPLDGFNTLESDVRSITQQTRPKEQKTPQEEQRPEESSVIKRAWQHFTVILAVEIVVKIKAIARIEGFLIKSKKRYLSPKDGREHSKFSWEPVTVGDLWVDETDRKCQMHFVVYRSSGSIEQVDQPISRQSYTLFGSYKLDAHRVDLIDKVLRKNRTGLRIRKWTATEMLHLKVTKRLMDELLGNAEKCGQNLSQYCTTLLSGKHPRAAFTEEELELLRNLKKSRGDVLLQFNAMVAEFAHKSDEERFRAVIHGKSFDWWREHLITALEFFDRMRDRTLNMGG